MGECDEEFLLLHPDVDILPIHKIIVNDGCNKCWSCVTRYVCYTYMHRARFLLSISQFSDRFLPPVQPIFRLPSILVRFISLPSESPDTPIATAHITWI